MKACKRMCRECPWRKTSAAGYLGGYGVDDFIDSVRHGQAIPCHMSLDEDEDYSDETEFAEMLDNGEVQLCHGALKAMQMRCVRPRNSDVVDAMRSIKEEPTDDIMNIDEFRIRHTKFKL